MIVCITATDKHLDAPVDPTFGRARYFLVVDTDTETCDVVENMPSAHGAGVQAAQIMVDKLVSAVLTGNVGPNAYQGLTAAGIKVFVGAKGTARETLRAYKNGALEPAQGATRMGHGGRG